MGIRVPTCETRRANSAYPASMGRYLALAFVVVGCASSSHEVLYADGSTTRLYVACKRDMGNCYREAAATCPDGFSIVDSGGRTSEVQLGQYTTCSGTAYSAQCYSSGGGALPVFNGAMLVDCKGRVVEKPKRTIASGAR